MKITFIHEMSAPFGYQYERLVNRYHLLKDDKGFYFTDIHTLTRLHEMLFYIEKEYAVAIEMIPMKVGVDNEPKFILNLQDFESMEDEDEF